MTLRILQFGTTGQLARESAVIATSKSFAWANSSSASWPVVPNCRTRVVMP